MEIKKNCREFTLITLGVLLIITPFVIFGSILFWIEIVLGIAVIIAGAWPLIPKKEKGII